MNYHLTIDTSSMHPINRSAILEVLRNESPVSSTYIFNKLSLSPPTVMRIVDEFSIVHKLS